MRPTTIVLLIGALGTAACGDDGSATPDAPLIDAQPPDAMPREVITSTQPLMPGELVEGIMNAGAGDVAVIELSGQLPHVEWNIHGHAGGGTQVVYEEFDKMTVRYVFAPTSHADWYLLVRNGGTISMEVDVRVELYGDTMWRWQ